MSEFCKSLDASLGASSVFIATVEVWWNLLNSFSLPTADFKDCLWKKNEYEKNGCKRFCYYLSKRESRTLLPIKHQTTLQRDQVIDYKPTEYTQYLLLLLSILLTKWSLRLGSRGRRRHSGHTNCFCLDASYSVFFSSTLWFVLCSIQINVLKTTVPTEYQRQRCNVTEFNRVARFQTSLMQQNDRNFVFPHPSVFAPNETLTTQSCNFNVLVIFPLCRVPSQIDVSCWRFYPRAFYSIFAFLWGYMNDAWCDLYGVELCAVCCILNFVCEHLTWGALTWDETKANTSYLTSHVTWDLLSYITTYRTGTYHTVQ